MEIKINRIIYKSGDNPEKEYKIIEDKINIIKGASRTGKTPFTMMLLIALGNSAAKEFYFDQYNATQDNVVWEKEKMVVEYVISHKNKKCDLSVMVEADPKNKELLISLKDSRVLIFEKEEGTTALKKYLIKKLNIPKKIFWKQTIRERTFSEFHSFFTSISNLRSNVGNFYDVANTKAAPYNAFISAYAFLVDDKKAIKMLNTLDNIKDLEKIVRDNNQLSDIVSAFEYSHIDSKSPELSARRRALMKKMEKNINEIEELKTINSNLKTKMTKSANKIKEIEMITKKYNKHYNAEIHVDEFISFLKLNDKYKNVTIEGGEDIVQFNLEEIRKLENEKHELMQTMSNNNFLEEFDLAEILKEKANSIIDRNEKILGEQYKLSGNYSNEDEEKFQNLFSSWNEKYHKLYKDVIKKVNNNFPGTFSFSGKRATFGIGGRSYSDYFKFVYSIFNLASQENRFVYIVDSLYETKNDSVSEDKTDRLNEFVKYTNNNAILTMTNLDFEDVKNVIDDRFVIHEAPNFHDKAK